MPPAPPHFADHPAHARVIVAHIRAACDPAALLVSHLARVSGTKAPAGLLAIGKAADAMMAALSSRIPDPALPRLVLAPTGRPEPPPLPSTKRFLADHPIPTDRNLAAASAVEAFLRQL